jgi:hypothetical protein
VLKYETGASDGVKMLEDPTQGYNPTMGLGMCLSDATTTRVCGVIADQLSLASVADPAENVKGMYRLLDLISESGSNGYGKGYFLAIGQFELISEIAVDKIVIAQNSLQRFINDMSPGAYASITRVDFKTLDRLAMKPLGVYGSKDEIVRLLRSIGAVDETGRVILVFSVSCF